MLTNSTFAQFTIQEYNSIRNPETSVVSEDGQQLYVAQSKGLTVYSIDQQTKALAILQTIQQENGLGDACITPDNRFVLASCYGKNAIAVYRRAENGKLTLYKFHANTIDGITIKKPSSLVLSPSGRYLFVDCDRTLFTFRFQEGELEYITQNTLEGSYHGQVYFSPDNKHVFIDRYGSAQECYMTILTLDEQTGQLETVDCLEDDKYPIPGSYFDFFGERRQYMVSARLDYLTFSPDGKDVYMYGTEHSDNGGEAAIMHYKWINGQLRLQKAYYGLDTKYKVNGMKNMYLDGSGDYFYVLSGGEDSGIFIFKRDPTTGSLTFVKAYYKLQNLPRIVSPYRISFSPDNKGVFVSNYFGGNVLVLKNKAGKPGPQKRPLIEPSPPAPITNNTNDSDINYNNQQSNNQTPLDQGCEFPIISTDEIAQIDQALKAFSTEKERYDYALKKLQNRCLQTMQVLRIARLFEVEYLRLELTKFAYYYTADVENFYLLDTLFTSNRLKAAFKKHLEG